MTDEHSGSSVKTEELTDIQMGPARLPLAIDRVGVRGVKLPLTVRDRVRGQQSTVASVDLAVDLPSTFAGTHMSRFVEALTAWSETLDYDALRNLLTDVRERLKALTAHVTVAFPFFVEKPAPVSGTVGPMHHECVLTGELVEGSNRPRFTLELAVPVMTVCPCSKAICAEGAHSQRATVRMACRFTKFLWLEELIDVAESAASSPVYSILKREDEKAVVERAFAHPAFVEDVVRHAADALSRDERITWFRVEVESHESIHNHNAFAAIEGPAA